RALSGADDQSRNPICVQRRQAGLYARSPRWRPLRDAGLRADRRQDPVLRGAAAARHAAEIAEGMALHGECAGQGPRARRQRRGSPRPGRSRRYLSEAAIEAAAGDRPPGSGASIVRSPFPQPPRVVVFTGPGLAREAGFAPFDPATLPPGLGIEDVVTEAGFARDPDAVYGFYNQRRRTLRAAEPSVAHEGLAALDLARSGELLVVTRNLDDLHERAGAQAVIHTHGELLKARCAICTKISDW